MPGRPFLLVRARIHPAMLTEFRTWYRLVHLPHVLAIPGIVGYRELRTGTSAQRGTPNVLSVFIFENDSVIQTALSSAEAARARQDWEVWSNHVRDLSIQVYTSVNALVSVRHLN